MGWKMSLVLGLIIVSIFPATTAYIWQTSSGDLLTQDKAVLSALNFLKRSPTFRFDGIPDTVKVVKVETLRMPWTWEVTIAFVCRNSGYGDRTGKITMPVLTPHEIRISVSRGVVKGAIIDEKWDEIKQQMLGV